MTVKKISAKDFHDMLKGEEKVVLLDVRAEDKYHEFHIEDPKVEGCNIPKTIIFGQEEEGGKLPLPKDREIIVTCTTGNSAAKCADILERLDYQVKVLEGGVTAWKDYLNALENK